MEGDKRLSETALSDYIKTCRKSENRGKQGSRKREALRPTRKPISKPKKSTPKAKPHKKLEIKNIHVDMNNKEIYDLFAKFGTLTKCKLLTDEIGRSKGIAIVEFETSENAQKAIEECNQKDFKGNKVEVKFAERKGKVEFDRKRKIEKPRGRNDNERNDRGTPRRRNDREDDRDGRRDRKYSDDRRDNRKFNQNRESKRSFRGGRNTKNYDRRRSDKRY